MTVLSFNNSSSHIPSFHQEIHSVLELTKNKTHLCSLCVSASTRSGFCPFGSAQKRSRETSPFIDFRTLKVLK